MLRYKEKIQFILFVLLFTEACLIQMNSDGTSRLNKNVVITPSPSVTSTSSSVPDDKGKSSTSEEGWNTKTRDSNSDDTSKSENDSWYTQRYKGKANERSIGLNSPAYMEVTCKQSVKKQNGKLLIESAISSLGSSLKPETIAELAGKILTEDFDKLESSDCKPLPSDGSFAECECELSYKVEGGKQKLNDKISALNKK